MADARTIASRAAALAGVAAPVRVMPDSPRKAGARHGSYGGPDVSGAHCVFLSADVIARAAIGCPAAVDTIAHEIVHCAQLERLGADWRAFLGRYRVAIARREEIFTAAGYGRESARRRAYDTCVYERRARIRAREIAAVIAAESRNG